ncbi:MAG: trypsin-like peptidase domain-containing protein [Fimbriiglobus sp.]|jgi:serine protease Do|nr:trypsin-like peptidase domain-containing protein [Fimbriiglobus sp.]
MPDSASAAITAPIVSGTSKRRDETVELVERVKTAVVNIHSERTVSGSDDPFRPNLVQPQRVNGMGTGIVLDPRGYVVTNYHVVDDVQSLRCRLADGTNLAARVLAVDKESDLALIKIDPNRPLPLVPLGTAQDLMLAEKVIAIGNAFGYEHTVTTGSVSALKRDVTLNKEVSYKSLIQTQTPINPGNSGGPLFNKMGEVVGVNVAIRAGAQNIAFAIPVDTMITKAADMLAGRKGCGGRFGLTLASRYERPGEETPLRRWVAVQRVESGSAASDAGLKAGDEIEQVGDVAVCTAIDFERGFLDRTGKTKLRVKRGGEVFDAELGAPVFATERSVSFSPPIEVSNKLGIKASPVGPGVVQGIDKQLRGGLWLTEVAATGLFGKAGLQKGDILLGMHQWETLSMENVNFVFGHKDLATFNPVRVIFVRDGKIRESTLTVE